MADTNTLARPYARAIFELARAEDNQAAWSTALAMAGSVVVDPVGKAFLSRRDLDDEGRVSFLQTICAEAGDGVLSSGGGANLLRLLAENDRLVIVPEISVQFDTLKAWAENTVKVQLVTATSVQESVVKKIKDALEKKMRRAVELELQEDPGLLGGAVIHAEGRVIDGSVKGRLSELAEILTS